MALSKLDSLYMAVVAEHSRSPHHKGRLTDAEVLELHNPTCGDMIQLSVKIEGDMIRAIAFDGHGCSISTASASMMTDLVVNESVSHALDMAELFSEMVQGQNDPRQKELGDAAFLAGVAKFPQRIKCATLAWNALKEVVARHQASE
ncbi:nitrogen fixation NifU-like protein [Streptococcus rupicaprae]|uniref:Nitrogen fixation NifU-like protein n=1 Tax=Streptococcus rupicaprae TaxID=759619 RepID=A0ABV2FGU0_9STRE